ncbi:MAG: type II secretion system major pseudopilin GspG [Maricaulaceae bacterium]
MTANRKTQTGLTLLELLIVLAILGLIAAFAAPRVVGVLGGAKTDAATVQIDNIAAALDLFRLEVGRYPTTEEGLQSLMAAPNDAEGWNGPYLDKPSGLVDPWGAPYDYRFPGENSDYEVFTLGADGQEGGEGENADVSNWS